MCLKMRCSIDSHFNAQLLSIKDCSVFLKNCNSLFIRIMHIVYLCFKLFLTFYFTYIFVDVISVGHIWWNRPNIDYYPTVKEAMSIKALNCLCTDYRLLLLPVVY